MVTRLRSSCFARLAHRPKPSYRLPRYGGKNAMVAKPDIARPPVEPSPPHPLRMTWEEFLNYNAEDFYAEWVNGEIMLLNAPGDEHQQLATFLTTILTVCATTTGAGTVRAAPFVVRLANSGRHPDVM